MDDKKKSAKKADIEWYEHVSKIVEERDTPDAKFVSHDEFWSYVDQK